VTVKNAIQNAGQNREIKTGNKSFENVTVQVFGNDSNKIRIKI
jgi:hypothetical protein